jgi:hypothetical protein
MGPYLPLFSLEVEHSYFPGNVCRSLGLVPTAESARRLERTGCLLRPTDRGLIVLFDASAADALRMHAGDVDEPLRFHFLARATDPAFANYTDATIGASPSLLMLDSRRAALDEGSGRWRLHAAAAAGAADLRGLDSPEAIEALSVHERRAPPHFAVSVGIEAAEVAQAARGQGRRYVCRLEARATVWKYVLFGDLAEATKDQDEVLVVDLGQAFQFAAAVGERLPDGQSVLTVRSAAPIALQERSERRFQLRRRGSGTDKVLIKRLPVASPRQLSRETLGGIPTLVSEIYVHR